MEVERERSNLNKSPFFSCLQNNRQKHSSQAICVNMILELYSQKKNQIRVYYQLDAYICLF